MADRANRWAAAVQIVRLGDNDEDVRLKAREEILRIGQDAAPILSRAIDGELIPPEAQSRAHRILAEIKPRFAGEKPDVLMQAMEDSEGLDACAAVSQALVNFGAAATEPLLALLHRGDKEIYSPAAQALAQIAKVDPSIIPAVIEAMGDENWNVRSGAVKVLSGLESPLPSEAIPPLVRSLNEEDGDRRNHIIWTLEEFGAAATPALLESLRSPNWCVRAGAAKALGFIEIGRKLGADRESYFEMGVAPSLVERLVDQNVEVLKAAGAALSMIGPPESNPAIPAFLNILREKNPETFRAATAEMSWVPNTEPGLESELIDALSDTDSGIRASAAELLGLIKTPSTSAAVPALLGALLDEAEEVRFEAAVALARIAPEVSTAGIPILHTVLVHEGDWTYRKDPTRPWKRRECAIHALARHGAASAEAVQPLIDALREYCLADTAAYALGCIGPLANAAVPALLKALESTDEDIHNAAARALAAIGPEATSAAVALSLERLRDPGELTRGSAADCLAEIGLPAAKVAIPALNELMSDESAYIRYHAGWALRVLGCDVPDSELGLHS